MELQRTVTNGANLSSECEVLAYAYAGPSPLEVMVRVDLGDVSKPIAGGGNYALNFYVNGVLITPVSVDPVPAGRTRTIVVSRSIPLSPSDAVSVRVLGLGGDTSVNVTASLRTTTPIKKDDIFGAGSIPVDHDYGGAGNLLYAVAGGQGVDGAAVLAYLKSDYDAGHRSAAYVLGQTTTTTGGRWSSPLMLSPGAYTLIAYRQGSYGPDRKDLTVT